MPRKASSPAGKNSHADKLRFSAEVAVKEVLALKKGEKILIITNPEKDVLEISWSIYNASEAVGGCPTMVIQPVKTQLDFAEPAVLAAQKSNPDVILSISKEKLGNDAGGLKKPYVHKGVKYDSYFTYLLGSKKSRSLL